jgi:uncharacterized membrane protein (UPF0182 family)
VSQVGVSRVRRRWLFLVVGAIVFLGILLSGLTGFYIDLLWFREVRFSSVFWSVFWSRVVLGLTFGTLFFLLLAANLFIVRRLTPRYRPISPDQEIIERYRVTIEPYARLLIPAFAALIAILVGIAASAQWETFLLWRSAGTDGNFGLLDPQFSRDPSFYIFILPFQKFVQGWLFSALVGVTVITAAAHYLTGGIRLQAVGEKVTPQVKAHLSVLLGLIVLVKAWGYWLGRFDLLVSPRGVVTGASYTDVNAQLPALTLLVFIAIACAVLFLVNIRFRGWALPVLGIGLLALTSIVAGAIVPTVVQRLSVDPQEFQREQVYIERNIEATRQALGLDRIELSRTSVGAEVSAEEVAANQPTIDNVRLWDPVIIRETYENLQRIQPYYVFPDVDVDRYEIDGERRVVMISAREVSQDGIPGGGSTWQNRHLFYTHGYGAVASPVNTVTSEGQPVFELADIPPPADAGIELDPDKGAQVYYGENSDVPYVVVGTQMNELNYPASGGQEVVETTYTGEGGIPLGGYFRRLVFSYRYRDVNLLISGLINRESRILINRDIEDRIKKAAPFLMYDHDPYAAIVDGRLVYILDAYTTTDLYPYSERVDLGEATEGELTGRVNYMRNSVKAVVDAYDGTVSFHVVDDGDPLIRVWRSAFPDLFATEPPPASLREHFRYPENLLQVQSLQFANYHVTQPRTFYSKENFWAIPTDPISPQGSPRDLRPYYVMIKLPGETEEEFVLFTPFTPFDRPNMIAYLAAKSDPDTYGELVAFEFPSGDPPDGPQQVFARINQNAEFARERTLLGQQGSRVVFGNLFVVPIDDAFLYVQPVFVRSNQTNAIPELKRVVVVNGGTVALGDTFPQALAASLGQGPPPPEDGGEPPPGDVAQLIARALEHFQAADDLLRQGDLAGYQREIEAAQALIEQANELAGGSAQPSPSPSPSP